MRWPDLRIVSHATSIMSRFNLKFPKSNPGQGSMKAVLDLGAP